MVSVVGMDTLLCGAAELCDIMQQVFSSFSYFLSTVIDDSVFALLHSVG